MRTLLRIAAVLSFALVAAFGLANSAVAQNMTDADAYANVVVCDDAECADLAGTAGMEGAVITSFDAAGAEIDSCAVETFASGMDGCVITKHAGDGSYAVSNMTAGYALLDEAPEVLESESHGTQLVWYAAPADDAAPPVSEVPDVGVGIGSQTDLLAAAAFGIALLAVGATAMRRYGRM